MNCLLIVDFYNKESERDFGIYLAENFVVENPLPCTWTIKAKADFSDFVLLIQKHLTPDDGFYAAELKEGSRPYRQLSRNAIGKPHLCQ